MCLERRERGEKIKRKVIEEENRSLFGLCFFVNPFDKFVTCKDDLVSVHPLFKRTSTNEIQNTCKPDERF